MTLTEALSIIPIIAGVAVALRYIKHFLCLK